MGTFYKMEVNLIRVKIVRIKKEGETMIFNDGFDAEDTAILGGIIGFAEDSIKNEELGENDDDAIPEISDDQIADCIEQNQEISLQLLYNENPELVQHLIKRAYQDRARSLQQITEKEIQAVREEMLEELRTQQKNSEHFG